MWKCKETMLLEVAITVTIKMCQFVWECPLLSFSSQPTDTTSTSTRPNHRASSTRHGSSAPGFKPWLGNVWPSGTNLNKNTLQPTSLYSWWLLRLHRRVTTTEPVRRGTDRQPQGSNLGPAVPDLLVPHAGAVHGDVQRLRQTRRTPRRPALVADGRAVGWLAED